MVNLLLAAAVLFPGLKTNLMCPRPILVNININHKIDRLVFKRALYHCRRQFKRNPCLLRFAQPQRGAFHVVCGLAKTGLVDGLRVAQVAPAPEEEATFEPSCSSEIFDTMPMDWAMYQNSPIVPKVSMSFCESLDITPDSPFEEPSP
ncbi:MAG: hypothetical protein H7249_03705 [Chitinophagaceae bacterium]|nr:hypothetical protein [Oligoflexus sp.]